MHKGNLDVSNEHDGMPENTRPVILIVTEWPGGTMAMKFGYALQAALQVNKEDMALVQMQPERIFRVSTHVNEEDFWLTLRSKNVSCPGRILFIPLSG